MQAIVECEDFDAGDAFSLAANVTVRTMPLNHPNGATGYRIEYGGRSACYVTDTEHVPEIAGRKCPEADRGGRSRDLRLLLHRGGTAQASRLGPFHLERGVRVCRLAGARRLAIFHHDPDHEDDFMDVIEAQAKATWDGTFVAREGMVIDFDTF